MAGLVIFRTMDEARRAGFEYHDRTKEGYVVRARTPSGWALALVIAAG